jgi:hypothetical protein
VELEEARAIAREVAIAGESPSRPVPLSLMGQYRTEGRGETRRISIQLKLMRGDREVAQREAKSVPLKDAAGFLRRVPVEMVDPHSKPDAAPNADAEAEQLAAREHEFLQIGQWQDAIALPDLPGGRSVAARARR